MAGEGNYPQVEEVRVTDPARTVVYCFNSSIEPVIAPVREGELECRERLGGLLRYYYREAA